MLTNNRAKLSSHQNHIPQSLIDLILKGDVRLQSADIFQQLLKMFPNEPFLIRMHGDLLNKNGLSSAAAGSYSEAAGLYLKKGKILSFIALKTLQWRINPPTQSDFDNFLLNLKQGNGQNTPIRAFFSRLNLQELMAFYSQIEIIGFPSGHVIKSVGDLEDNLYFLISGTLQDSFFLTIDNNEKFYRKPSKQLSEGDYFGDIYPFDQIRKSKSYIETKSQVELIKIAKENLVKICRKYPNIEVGILNLLQVRSKVPSDNSHYQLRNERRIKLRLEFSIEIYLKTLMGSSIYLKGCSSDVSIGGICFILNETSFTSASEISSFEKIINNAKVQVNFPIEDLTVKIPGHLTWVKSVSFEGRKTIALGIQFKKMSPILKGLLLSFFNCFDNNQNKSLIS